ncbi:MAG: hypothetical protein WC139_07205 [Candidatus Kapaibacterium sp.]
MTIEQLKKDEQIVNQIVSLVAGRTYKEAHSIIFQSLSKIESTATLPAVSEIKAFKEGWDAGIAEK